MSDSHKLTLASELCSVNDTIDGKTEHSTTSSSLDRSQLADNAAAKKVNQWHFCGIKGVIHNREYFFNSGSLTGDELLCQFMHVVSCYESIGVHILGCVCDAGGQNSRLFTSLRYFESIDSNTSWHLDDCVLIRNPAIPS